MRLHSLRVTAFGPFAATVEVDFDALADAGLFLLAGPTGAGKSSILDAVCFALYGAVPGERNAAGRLRADQAAPGLAPEVTLEATIAGRRLRIVRGPRWERPKKRGAGTTTEQARVVLSEEAPGGWRVLSTRLDESGHLLGELLGMNLTQFCQVVMLPQNNFAAFLRSGPDERRALLQKLFRSGRFDRMEGWLRDHRIGCRRESETHHRAVAALTSRVSEVAGVAPEVEVSDLADLTGAAGDGRLAAWVSELLQATGAELAESVDLQERAADLEAATRSAYDEARRVDARWRRVRVAHDELARLTAAHDSYEVARARLTRARQASAVLPLSEVHERRRAERELAGQAWASLAEVSGPDPDARREAVAAELTRVQGLRPAEVALQRLLDDVARTAAALTAARSRLDLVRAESTGLPQVLAGLEATVQSAERAAAELPALRAQAARLESCAAAYTEAEQHTVSLTEAVAELQSSTLAAQDARQALLDLRERRIEGMAAELAGALAVGADCPVCGSHEHPRPAAARPGAPDAGVEREAQRTLDTANAEQHARGLLVRDLEAMLAAAQARCGDAPQHEVRAELNRVQGAVAGEAARAADLDRARTELVDARARMAQLVTDAGRLEIEIAGLVATSQQQKTRVDELTAEVGRARGDHATLDDVAAELTEQLTALESASAARAAAAAADLALAEAASTLDAAAVRIGFESAAAALAVALPSEEVEQLASSVSLHETGLAAARAVLSDAEGESLPVEPPDLETLARELDAAVAARETSQSRHTMVRRRADRLASLEVELGAALAAWAPVRERLELATQVSAFVEGKSADNTWKMRLSTFVLAYRLGQVVDAANDRLGRMSSHRYALEHSGRRGAGEMRGGLSLLVRDDWSGESRDPATLSGGETFVVSLALALGLADVISHESGGARLETLFVDEGFGALDAETLDDVLDVLDTLREGGRVVGVVSHVPEMRDRIPTQVRVAKSPGGSTITHHL